MPNWLDYLNPDNAEKNRKIAEDIKNGVVSPNTTNQSVNTASNSTGSSNNYNPTENRFTAVNPDNAQNNLDWINSQQAQTSQSSQNAQYQAQQASAVKQHKEAREAQEAQQAEAARQEREAQEAREAYQRQVEQRRNQDRETREQEREARKAEKRSRLEDHESEKLGVDHQSESSQNSELSGDDSKNVWTNEENLIVDNILAKKDLFDSNEDGNFSLNTGEEMILPEFLPKTGAWTGYWDHAPKELIAGSFASKVYNAGGDWDEIPDGWTISKWKPWTANGYNAELFFNRDTKEIIVAHKGSNFSLNPTDADWVGNLISLAKNEDHYQVQYGLEVHDILHKLLGEDWQIIHAGHSLGGHIAEAVASQKGTLAYSFDPLYSNDHDSYGGIWRYAPPNGVHDITSNGNLPNRHTKNVHSLDKLLNRLNKQISEDRDDHINPIADEIVIKSEFLKGIF